MLHCNISFFFLFYNVLLLQHKTKLKTEIVAFPDSTGDKQGLIFLKRNKIPHFVDLTTVTSTKPSKGNHLPLRKKNWGGYGCFSLFF